MLNIFVAPISSSRHKTWSSCFSSANGIEVLHRAGVNMSRSFPRRSLFLSSGAIRISTSFLCLSASAPLISPRQCWMRSNGLVHSLTISSPCFRTCVAHSHSTPTGGRGHHLTRAASTSTDRGAAVWTAMQTPVRLHRFSISSTTPPGLRSVSLPNWWLVIIIVSEQKHSLFPVSKTISKKHSLLKISTKCLLHLTYVLSSFVQSLQFFIISSTG